MKWYLWLIMLTLVGCSTVKSTPTVDTKAQDVAFEVALKASVEASHKEEMEALTAQAEVLARIEESVASLKPSSTPVEASETESGRETLETDETTPNKALEPLEVTESEPETSEPPVKIVKTVELKWPSSLRVVYWYGTPCPLCETMTPVLDLLKDADVELREIEVFHVDDEGSTVFSEDAVKFNVRRAPTLDICKGSTVVKRFDGVCTIEDIADFLEEYKMDSIVSSCSPSKTESVSPYSSIVRNPGPRWNWNGDWNPSEEYAQNHLLEAHGIDASGLSLSEMEALHDNAHNGTLNTVTYSSPVRTTSNVRYSTSKNGNRFFGVFRSRSCPGGNCP